MNYISEARHLVCQLRFCENKLQIMATFKFPSADSPGAPRVNVEGHLLVRPETSFDSPDFFAGAAQVPARNGRTVPPPDPEVPPTGRPFHGGDAKANVGEVKHRLCNRVNLVVHASTRQHLAHFLRRPRRCERKSQPRRPTPTLTPSVT